MSSIKPTFHDPDITLRAAVQLVLSNISHGSTTDGLENRLRSQINYAQSTNKLPGWPMRRSIFLRWAATKDELKAVISAPEFMPVLHQETCRDQVIIKSSNKTLILSGNPEELKKQLREIDAVNEEYLREKRMLSADMEELDARRAKDKAHREKMSKAGKAKRGQ